MDRDVLLLECDGRELKSKFKDAFRFDFTGDGGVCANKKSHSSSGFGNRLAQFPQIGRTSSHLIFRALQTLHPSLDFL